VVTTVAANPTI